MSSINWPGITMSRSLTQVLCRLITFPRLLAGRSPWLWEGTAETKTLPATAAMCLTGWRTGCGTLCRHRYGAPFSGPWADGIPAWRGRRDLFAQRQLFSPFRDRRWRVTSIPSRCSGPTKRRCLFTRDFQQQLADYDSLDVLRKYYDEADTTDPLSRIQYVDIKTYLPDDILTKVDRASMAVSLELRAPILDHQFMELVASIPSDLKLRGRTGKYIFKKAMEPLLPHDILYRPKQGFAIPLDRWFRGELKDLAYDLVMESNKDGILDRNYLSMIWKQHQAGRFDRSAYLWTVLMFRKWQQVFQA